MLNFLIDQKQFDDYAGDASTIGEIGISETELGTLEFSSDRDWFAIELEAGATYEFSLEGQTLSDPYLRLYDEAEKLILSNDDHEESLNSQLSFTPENRGTFYLEAGAFADLYTGSYQLSMALISTVDDYAGNTNTTGTLTIGKTQQGNLETIGDRDWFAIELEAGATYQFDLNGDSLSDPYLRLYDEDGNFIDYEDDTNNSLDSVLSFTATSSETFYLSAGSFADVYTGSYELSAELVVAPPPPATEPGETLNSALDLGTLNPNATLQTEDQVSQNDFLDLYRFHLDSPLSIEANLNNFSSDLDLALLDNNGNPITFSRNDQTQNEVITETLETGSYYLAVYPYAGSSTFSLDLTARTPPELPDGYSSDIGYGEAQVDQALATLLNTELATVEELGDENWGIDRIGAPTAWEMGYTGEDLVVAVLDTGVDTSHTDLQNNIWVNSDEIPSNGLDDDSNGYIDDTQGWDFANYDNDPNDVNGHGTHVAGSIAAEDNNWGTVGVAPDAEIMPVQVLADNGLGFNSDIIAGINYAVDNGADIINLSLGASRATPAIHNAIQSATDAGILVVMGAGNSAGSTPDHPGAFAVEEGLVVGALNQEGDLASFSNQAGEIPQDYEGDGLAFPRYVTAPGVDVVSTVPNDNFASLSGTSMATPHVAGSAALLMQADPTLTPEETVDLITATTLSQSESGGFQTLG
ncbi:peptidase S8 and S53 subtilisin kexin sedolisin [Halothece sp. PCC 7418]|uniref:S8 family peptidase n=1 Tax=Halothece sp. (strain PCC 7418) TaxID=65093 RepID=UPI0002A06E11|nr:S8 family serine peptidase [Halothece sp. PCC 7418]AFZ43226.1 peptidase S8 and S53 subtilisin kexin sedolisin [Halothece sp. PCC 7418]